MMRHPEALKANGFAAYYAHLRHHINITTVLSMDLLNAFFTILDLADQNFADEVDMPDEYVKQSNAYQDVKHFLSKDQVKNFIANQPDQPLKWHMFVPVLSSFHMPGPNALEFDAVRFKAISRHAPSDIVYISDIEIEDSPKWFKSVIAWAEKYDYQWIRFDSDGDIVDLPLYESDWK